MAKNQQGATRPRTGDTTMRSKEYRKWKKIQDREIPKPRMLIARPPKPVPITCKHGRGATSGRNKPEYFKPNIAESMLKGRRKIMRLLDRGIRLTASWRTA